MVDMGADGPRPTCNQRSMEMAKKVKYIGKDETATRTINAPQDGDAPVVRVSHTVKPDREATNRAQLVWEFDFSDVTRGELLELATRDVLIRKQAEWRKANNRDNADVWDNVTFRVRDILDETKKTADPTTKARNALAKLSPEERERLLKDMTQ